MAFCSDCMDENRHFLLYLGVALDRIGLPLSALPTRLLSGRGQAKARYFEKFCEFASRLGWGELLEAPDNKTLLLDTMLWEEAARRGISMREFRPFGTVNNTFVARLPDGRIIDFDGVPPPYTPLWWINNKAILKKKLSAEGFPVARGRSVFTRAAARRAFTQLRPPLIVKPTVGSASRHTTLHIETLDELMRAFRLAKEISPLIMIEEELRGSVYRPTLVGGALIATIRRDQPQVVGDGVSSVAELVAEANKNPRRQGPYFSKLRLEEARAQLARAGLVSESIPARGQRVILHQKINWSLGGTTADVSDEVHPENKKLFESTAQALRAPLVGIDFIMQDISAPWQEQERAGVIECNDMPYFDNHHLPFTGMPRDIAGPLWEQTIAYFNTR